MPTCKMHSDNILALIDFTLAEVQSHRVIEIMNERIMRLARAYVLKRDIDNFVSYFIYVLSSPRAPAEIALSPKLVRHFVQRTYAGFNPDVQEQQSQVLYDFIRQRLGDAAVINGKNLGVLRNALKDEEFTFEKLRERIVIGLLLKWLQGPVKKSLTPSLNDYIAFLATTFGQFESRRIINFETEDYQISSADLAALAIEFGFFETAMLDARNIIRETIAQIPKTKPLPDQFRFVFDALERLMKNTEGQTRDELTFFRDKIIVSISLIYLQDDFVGRDPEVQNLVNLFVSLYFQFRDKRYPPPP